MQHNNPQRISRQACLALALTLTSAAVAQTRYTITVVGPANSSQLPSMGIDDRGRIAGTCEYLENGNVEYRAWTFDPGNGYLLAPAERSTINGVGFDGTLVGSAYGAPTVFDWLGNPLLTFPNGSGSFMAVNRYHDIVGYVFDPMNYWAQTAVILDRNGNWLKIGAPNFTGSAAYGINDLGYVVGYAGTITGECRAFYYKDGMTFLPGTQGNSDVALNVNNALIAVGYSVTPTDQVLPVSWTLGPNRAQQRTMVLPTGFSNGFATAVNDSGQAVGTMWGSENTFAHAFLTLGDQVVDLNDLRAASARVYTLVSANGINAHGQITGLAVVRIHVGGPVQTVAYVATPLNPVNGMGK
ncbi:MAG: hypothetical protein JSS66_03475 [Armatimonadetes bacterium]|nr:hypothetical protein [Armatimonadota bacterium]